MTHKHIYHTEEHFIQEAQNIVNCINGLLAIINRMDKKLEENDNLIRKLYQEKHKSENTL